MSRPTPAPADPRLAHCDRLAAAAERLRAAEELSHAAAAASLAFRDRLDEARRDYLFWADVVAGLRRPPEDTP